MPVRKPSGCAVKGCDSAAYCRGLCSPHYRRLLQTGDVGLAVVQPRNRGPRLECSVRGCALPAFGKGWCRGHYARWIRTGEVGPAKLASRMSYNEQQTCAEPGCGSRPHSRGWCKPHYDRARRARPG